MKQRRERQKRMSEAGNDQVEAIKEQEMGNAALVNATMRRADTQEALENFKAGKLDFLFLAPEQLSHGETLTC